MKMLDWIVTRISKGSYDACDPQNHQIHLQMINDIDTRLIEQYGMTEKCKIASVDIMSPLIIKSATNFVFG